MDWSTVKMPCVDLQSVKDAKGQRWLTSENITVTNKPEEFRSYPIKFRILDKVDRLSVPPRPSFGPFLEYLSCVLLLVVL